MQLKLYQQLQDIQCLIKQEVYQTLRDNLSWLSPKNLCDELNQSVGLWSYWLLTDYNNALCTSLDLQIIFPGRVRDQQVERFVGSIAVLTKNKGEDIRNCSTCGKCSLAPTQKSQWV